MKQKTNFGKYLEEQGYSTNTFAAAVDSSQSTIWRLAAGKLFDEELVVRINLYCAKDFTRKDFELPKE